MFIALVEIYFRSCRNLFTFLSKSSFRSRRNQFPFLSKTVFQQFTDFNSLFQIVNQEVCQDRYPNGLTIEVNPFGHRGRHIGFTIRKQIGKRIGNRLVTIWETIWETD